MSRLISIAVMVMLIICVALGLLVYHYRDSADEYRRQRDEKTAALTSARATITDMQVRQRDVAALDAKYTKELSDAKAENEALRADVAAGRRQLRVRVNCAAAVREATGPTRVDNATSPRLADTAERDYFTLRERLMTMQMQLEGAQEYIRTQRIK
ncbi:TPA: lysis protein [Escherichia coli]|nr:lysis protein [Escherichia coli]